MPPVRGKLDLQEPVSDALRQGSLSLAVLESSEEEGRHPVKTFTLALLLTVPALADEVVLKDGRKIEFKALEDSGATYIVTTPEGARVVVKRSEVEGLAKTEPASALTGASFSFDKKAKLDSTDLLKKVETTDFLSGIWKVDKDGSLQCEAANSCCCQFRFTPTSEEYNLVFTIERLDGDDNIGITFPVPGGQQAQYFFDVDHGKYSAVLIPGGPEGHLKASAPAQGKQFALKKPRTVVLMVRKTGLVVQVDGKDVTTYRTDWSKSVPLGGVKVGKDVFAVMPLTTSIRVTKAAVMVAQKS